MYKEKIKEMVANFEKTIRVVQMYNESNSPEEIDDILSWSGALLICFELSIVKREKL